MATDSRQFGSAVLATVSIDPKNLGVFTRVANALNKQQPAKADAMAQLLGKALDDMVLRERYNAFPAELKAKVVLRTDGRLYFTVIGAGLTGSQWFDRLETIGYTLSAEAKSVLSNPGYDMIHRLEAGKQYTVVLSPTAEIRDDEDRTTMNLGNYASAEFGKCAVHDLKAELIFLIREKFTDADLEAMGVEYITMLHTPITDPNGTPCLFSLCLDFCGKSYMLHASEEYSDAAYPDNIWNDSGMLAFFI